MKRGRSAWCVEEDRGACAARSAKHREVVDRSAGRTARVTRACADSKSELARRAATSSRLLTMATAKVSMYEYKLNLCTYTHIHITAKSRSLSLFFFFVNFNLCYLHITHRQFLLVVYLKDRRYARLRSN